MPPWRILLVSLLAGVWGVSGGPPSSSSGSQKPSARASIVFPYDDYNQFTSVSSSYYGSPSAYSAEPMYPGAPGGGTSYSSLSMGVNPTFSDAPAPAPAPAPGATRTYIFPQEEIIMGSAASHNPYNIYYADPPSIPKLSGYPEHPGGYRTSYGTPKAIYARDTYKQGYDSISSSNYGLHPAVASNINRLRKPYYLHRDRVPRYPAVPAPQSPYYYMPTYKKLHSKYPVKEIPNPDVINNALIASPFNSKFYKPKLPLNHEEDPQNQYEDQTVKRPKKKHPQKPQAELNFEIQPSIELDINGGVVSDRGKKGYEYDSEKHQSAPQSEFYKYSNGEKPYKTSYDSDKEFYGKYKKAVKPRRPVSYDESNLGAVSYSENNYETSYRLEHPEPENYQDDDYGPVNPFVDEDGRKHAGATSYVSISKPRVIGFKTLRDREYRDNAVTSEQMEDTSEESVSPSPATILSYKPASSSVSNWTPINPPVGGGIVPARSYDIPAPDLSNKRAGIVTAGSIELDYDSRVKMIEDSRPIIGRRYRSSEGNGNISKLDNSEGVVSAVMFFKQ